ncbi:ABC transporter ATP-binding protein [Desulfobacter curvatus]|uniref:ABC transporter ATP-binding protein n=1 Tax=Desulfobacter curvatus TaxID=2290 RepID=UPI000360A92D|nr:ABC transporter ATP-binding protein [Desulfobacter curvatus]
MSNIIDAKNLGKQYRLHHGGLFVNASLKESFTAFADRLRRSVHPAPLEQKKIVPQKVESFWALKDLSFKVAQGERLGLIGRNGAGKSTLLKILSRITWPTTGQVKINGRVSSLLEVGTGFHPELTGRENIYLNGAILGMNRTEIRRKFDEIVWFAEIEKFLDTPAKRYSSGMYLRLAFAVAAHLEPDILLVDEVLAVGDASFREKCLGKMRDVGRQGRTIIMVSHSMAAIENLCTRVLVLDKGQKIMEGSPARTIQGYLNAFDDKDKILSIEQWDDRRGTGEIRIHSFCVLDHERQPVNTLVSGKYYIFRFGYKAGIDKAKSIDFSFTVSDRNGRVLFRNRTLESGLDLPATLCPKGYLDCRIPRLGLTRGRYAFGFTMIVDGVESDHLPGAQGLYFDVMDGDFFGTSQMSDLAPVIVDHKWTIDV